MDNGQQLNEENKIKYCDLFAGTGAFSLALKEYNYDCIFANDMVVPSKVLYEANFGKLTLGDLNNIDVTEIPKHNILCGGFPCQPFSIAGEMRGFDDKRSNVFWKILEIMKYCQPDIVILENVKNLVSHDKGNTFKTILKEIKSIDYTVKYSILDTCKVTNIPQHRERIYIICFRNEELAEKFNFDDIETNNNTDSIVDYLETNIDNKYYYTPKLKVYDIVKEGITKPITDNVLYQFRRYYVRENKSAVCPTLTANMGTGGHNVPLLRDKEGIRKLTPRECFNLQGFPKDYVLDEGLSDCALYKLAGNAVSVPVVQLLVSKLSKIIEPSATHHDNSSI